jgi:molybdenum cofactor guanylyltransferase
MSTPQPRPHPPPPPLPPPLTILILAGGESRRMGQDKALMPVDGKPLLQRTCEIALAVGDRTSGDPNSGDPNSGDRTYIFAPPRPGYAELLPLGCELICETWPEGGPQGPLYAFATALTVIQPEPSGWILLLACDLPQIQAEPLQYWAAQLQSLPPGAIAYLARHPTKGWETLCGFYRGHCYDSLQRFVANGGRSFQRWLHTGAIAEATSPAAPLIIEMPALNLKTSNLPTLNLPDPIPDIFLNCNTPEDMSHL